MKIFLLIVSIFIIESVSAQHVKQRSFKKGEFTRTNGYKFKVTKVLFGMADVEFINQSNKKEKVPFSELKSFTYPKGNMADKSIVAGVGAGVLLSLISGSGDTVNRPIGMGLAAMIGALLGGIVGIASPKYSTIHDINKHFASYNRTKPRVEFASSGLGVAIRF